MTTRAINQALGLMLGLAAAGNLAAANSDNASIRFLEARVADDALDTVAQNRLSAACIAQMRETGDLAFLERAARAARASLASVSAAQNPGGVAALAVAEFESHHFSNALVLAQQAYAIDPRNASALATAGDAQLELGNYAEAQTIYEQLNANESAPPVQARLARIAELKGDNQKAIELLSRALNTRGDTTWYRIRLGELYFRTGDFVKAGEHYEAARKRPLPEEASESPEAKLPLLHRMEERVGERRSSVGAENYSVLEHLAELRAAQGKFDEAIALYRQVISQAPRAEFFQALGDVYAFMSKPAEAKLWHERALSACHKSVAEGNAHYYHHLAGYYCDSQENPAEALRWARKDLEIRHSVYAHDTLAWALYKNGEFAPAAQEMTRALALGTKDPHLLFHAAMIYSRADELERGNALFKQALTINPRYNSFHAHR